MDGVGREIQKAKREAAAQRKKKWDSDHPKTAAFKKGWGKALKKEGRKLIGL